MTAIAKSYPGIWSDPRRISPTQDDHCDPQPNTRALYATLTVYLATVLAGVIALAVKFI